MALRLLPRRGQSSFRGSLPEPAVRLVWALVSRLLDYPTPALLEALPRLRSAADGLPATLREPLLPLLEHLGTAPLEELERGYVETFDLTRRGCLFLTYAAYGDTRRRGLALVQLKQAFTRSGATLADDELPDHLCVVLEFGATCDVEAAHRLLTDYRAGLEMLRVSLSDTGSPWAGAAIAVCRTLPSLGDDEAAAMARLIEAGPSQEDVGLQAYALDPRLNPRPAPVDLGMPLTQGTPS